MYLTYCLSILCTLSFPSLRPFFAKHTITTIIKIITSIMITSATVLTATPTLTADSAVGSDPD